MKQLISALAVLCLLSSPLSADIYELRTYTTHEGKLPDLLTRFRDHTLKIFESHGIKNIGYWVTKDEEGKNQKLVYIIAHKDSAAAKKSWANFRKDPAWQKAYKVSVANGKIVKKVESQYLTPTDFSKLK